MTSAYICNPLDLVRDHGREAHQAHNTTEPQAPHCKRPTASQHCKPTLQTHPPTSPPTSQVKTRLQARGRGTLQARGAAGAPAPSLSILHGFREVVAEGAAVQHLSRRQAAAQALWRGAHVSALRSALATAANMPAYTVSKEKLLAAGYSDGTLLHMFCGMVSGVATCTANNPVDVLRSRLYNQPTDPATGRGLHYNSPLHAAARIWQSEGPLAFYKGYGAHCLRAAPHFVLAFAFIEQSKRLLQWASSPA